ncbi:MAG: hypothetical protein GX117_09895 [Candidatus Hydrogenedentes bacterium]|nr:hypothetical protein [Candidatus Hydrogenedentota bacterium]
MTSSIRELLNKWSNECRNEVDKVLEVATIISISPNVHEYLEKEKERGRNIAEVTENLSLIEKHFEASLIQISPIDTLFDILRNAPDKTALRHLIHTLGDSVFLNEYNAAGREFLITADKIGTDRINRMLQENTTVSWREASPAFKTLEPESSEIAKEGLLILLETGMEYRGVVNSVLEIISNNKDLFKKLGESDLRLDEILPLISDKNICKTLSLSFEKDHKFTVACLGIWSEIEWKRYNDKNRLDALLAVASYRREECNESFESFAESLLDSDNITSIYLEYGLDGVRIWDAYVTKESGDLNRKTARSALDLYKEGFPAKDLYTPEDVQLAQWVNKFPFSKRIYSFLKKIGLTVNWVWILSVGLITLVFLFIMLIVVVKSLRIIYAPFKKRTIQTETIPDPAPRVVESLTPKQNILENETQNNTVEENEDD